MAITPPIHHWLGGDDMNAARMNEIKDSIDFLRNPPMVHVRRRSSNFTFTAASGSYFSIPFDTLVNSYDPYDMWDVGSPDVITIQVPGWYACEMVGQWAGTAQDLRFLHMLGKNGTTLNDFILRHDQKSLPNSATSIRKESMLYLNEGDTLRMLVSTEGTGTFTIAATSDSECAQVRVRWFSN